MSKKIINRLNIYDVTIIFYLSMILLNCQNKQENLNNKKHEVQLSIVSKITYQEAVNYFGEPLETTVFENAGKDQIFSGIRAGIGKYYKGGIKIIIKEAIWNKDYSIRIAVWYTKKQNQWIPFDSFEYDKKTDF